MKKRKKRLNVLYNINVNKFFGGINRNIKKNIDVVNKNIINIRKDFVRYHEPYSEISHCYKSMLVKITLPNVPKKNLLLKVSNGKIEVKGHTFVKEDKKRLLRGFYRSIDLPKNAIPDKAKAIYKNDTLKIKIPIHQSK